MKNALSLAILSGTLFCGSFVHAEFSIQAPDHGTVNITVYDENGALVPDAPVYIYGTKRGQFVGGAELGGSNTLSLKEGKYRVSSAYIKKTGEYIDRFASNEATIKVVNGDSVTIVLTLRALENPEQQRAQSYGTLHVAGIPGSLLSNN